MAEWLTEIGDNELPDDIKDHLEKCMDCGMEVLEVWELVFNTNKTPIRKLIQRFD